MTDARYPEAWLNDRKIVRLSDAAHRLMVTALAWSASNRTDGYIETADLALIHGVDRHHASELVDAGLWTEHQHGWQINEFHKSQTTKAQLEGLDQKRHQDRERKARERARKRGESDHPSDDLSRVTSAATSDATSDVTHRQGKDRQGQALTGAVEKRDDSRFWKTPEQMEEEKNRKSGNCSVCANPLNAALAAEGETTHPACESVAWSNDTRRSAS